MVVDLADQIPQGDFERPHAAVVELQVIQDGHVPLNCQWTLAQEELLMARLTGAGKAQHRISRTNAFQIAGAHADDGRGVCPARRGIPRGVERRVERPAIMANVDGVDDWFHNRPAAKGLLDRQDVELGVRHGLVGAAVEFDGEAVGQFGMFLNAGLRLRQGEL